MKPLAPSEWLVMRCMWDLRSANAQRVAEHARQRYGTELEPSTVGIYLLRLVRKGYLLAIPGRFGRGRPPHSYAPIVKWEDAFRLQVQKFLKDYRVDAETLDAVLKESFLLQPSAKKHRA